MGDTMQINQANIHACHVSLIHGGGDKAYKNVEMIAERPIRTLTQALYGGREKKAAAAKLCLCVVVPASPGSKSDCSGGVALAPEPTTV
jgi:hypothetical protein